VQPKNKTETSSCLWCFLGQA